MRGTRCFAALKTQTAKKLEVVARAYWQSHNPERDLEDEQKPEHSAMSDRCDVCQRAIVVPARDMLQCCRCSLQFHIRCIATSPEEFTEQGWACPACRAPPSARTGIDAPNHTGGRGTVPMRVILRVHGQKSNAIKATGPSVAALRQKWGAEAAAAARQPLRTEAHGAREANGRRSQQPRRATASAPFEVGAAIEGRFEGGEGWYPGIIARAHGDGTYDIDYNDGDQEQYVMAALIRLLPPLHQPHKVPKQPAAPSAQSSSSGRRSRRPGWLADFTDQEGLEQQGRSAVQGSASAIAHAPNAFDLEW